MFKLRFCLISVYLTCFITNFSCAESTSDQALRNPFQPQDRESFATPLSISSPHLQSLRTPTTLTDISCFRINYLTAAEAKEALQSICQNSKITVEPISNNIIFSGPKTEEAQLQKALKFIDIPSKQISLEAKVISISKEKSKNLGINWSWDIIPQKVKNNNNDNEGNNGNFKFYHNYSFNFGASLNALFSKGAAKLLASPHIITLPGKEGKIFIGDHIPYQIDKHDSGGTYTSTEYIDAGITLKYTPIINAEENMITASVHTEISTPTLVSELKNYRVTSRQANTTVRMRSGETLVIGGLMTNEEQKALQKIPFLGDIPLLGNLFKNKTHKNNETEIVLLLTPYISQAGDSPTIYKNKVKSLQQM